MVKDWKRWTAAAAATVVALGALAACGANSGSDDGDGTKITIFNSKSEIQSQLEELAESYGESHGVDVEVYYSNDTVAAHMATKYAANQPYTISMVDAKDVYSLGAEHAIDLSGEKWVSDTDQAISVNGKVLGFPVSVEARGLIYNADAIKKVTGKDFDPSTIKTTDDFKQIISDLKAGGMENPVGVMKEDWSLAAHYLPQVYEEQSDPAAFIKSLHDGADLNADARWTSLMDTFDVLKDNNYAQGDKAISAEREVTEQKLAKGEIAFMFGGNWDWAVLNQYEPSKNMGMMPVPQNDNSMDVQDKLVGGGSKYFFIDNSKNTSEAQQKAAKAFLNWLSEEKDGQEWVVNTAHLVSPFKSNKLEVADPLGKSVKKFADANKLINNYNYLPDDHYSVLGANFQKYLAGQEDRAALAGQIVDYWKANDMKTIQ
ncbi:ABC transporter substrate-binding protein [Alloscardovia macacae]|uniref:ABC transporter solute-binding protein n=1 Tax=Alloscardovia macacae TaxID=1160091 RepID=A0A1Y2SWK8_9BIFI|nr:ABC transporter substrate-binding protein [Alloscardovia macacae]OTA26713.1 capsular biosynthesis protein [Alloscardovia macacae]OTA29579.1 capsular biosynthesis protein [Alloscardovia macacae]OZG54882.1 ABC transporter solute-binding protein [Alloscardovia macacae]